MAETDDENAPAGVAADASGGPRAAPGPAADLAAASGAVAALVALGDHAAAARLAAASGDLRVAITLYERVWRFDDAWPLAVRLADRPLAIRLALDAGNAVAAISIADQIPREAAAELRAAASSFAARSRHWEAARMAERSGDAALAAGYYRRAGSLLDCGRLEERADRPREAGIAYEQALAAATNGDEAAAAHLALGRLLARLGRHRDAARALQKAMRRPATRLTAGRALTGQLVALGFRIAAAEVVRRLRRDWPELPDSPEDVGALDAADNAAASSPLGRMDFGGDARGAPGAGATSAATGLLRQRFKVLRSLGAGATSHVYLAEDTLMGQQVALKLLSVGTGAGGAERQAYGQFTREAEAAARLRHPNIVALHDADPAMGLFVLELMPRGTLADRLTEEQGLTPGAVRRLALDLLSALGAAHEAGMVHRDVKPANILFDAVGNAKLGDFGAAHLVDFGQTQTGGLLGTVAYMSPEQISGGTIGPPADLYALAVTLFEALTGRLPFPGPDIVAQHLGEEPPSPSACQPGARLTAAHDEVLLRALRKAPFERWQSAAQMAEAIRSWPATGDEHGAGVASPAAVQDAPSAHPPLSPAHDTTATDSGSGDVLLGRSKFGALFRHLDPELGRHVLLEVRVLPLVGDALARLQAVAAAGGPYLQRVLALSEDGRTVTYELCQGAPLRRENLSSGQRAGVAAAEAALANARGDGPSTTATPPAPRGITTSGGPVILVVEATESWDDAGPSPAT